MGDSARERTVVRLADLNDREGTEFDLRPEETREIRDRLDLLDLRKVRFAGSLRPEGKRGWKLDAQLGATVVQPCVVTLEPVTTRIEERVRRRYTPDYERITSETADRDGDGVPMPEDETIDPLPAALDLAEVMEEALALALPEYPKAEGADLGEAQFAGKGVAPLRDEDLKPFAGLAALRQKMDDAGDEEE